MVYKDDVYKAMGRICTNLAHLYEALKDEHKAGASEAIVRIGDALDVLEDWVSEP